MQRKLCEYSGIFQLWKYSVGHRRLLIRRPGTNEQGQVDLLFLDVETLNIKTEMEEISVIEVTTSARGEAPVLKTFKIENRGSEGMIHASNFVSLEYSGEYFSESPLWE